MKILKHESIDTRLIKKMIVIFEKLSFAHVLYSLLGYLLIILSGAFIILILQDTEINHAKVLAIVDHLLIGSILIFAGNQKYRGGFFFIVSLALIYFSTLFFSKSISMFFINPFDSLFMFVTCFVILYFGIILLSRGQDRHKIFYKSFNQA